MTELVILTGKMDSQALEGHLRRRLHRGIVVKDLQWKDEKGYFSLGITIPELVEDSERRLYRLHIPVDLTTGTLYRVGRERYRVSIENLDHAYERVRVKKDALVNRAEISLIHYSSQKFTKIAKVANGLNPIWEIIVGLWLEGELKREDVLHRKSNKEQMNRYLQFLASMGYVEVKDAKVHPGGELIKFMKKAGMSDPFSHQNAILGEVLERGYHTLKKKLRINILTPYIEMSNSYYLPSLISGEMLWLRGEQIEAQYRFLYNAGRRKPRYQFLLNLMELTEANILERKDDSFGGNREIFLPLMNVQSRILRM